MKRMVFALVFIGSASVANAAGVNDTLPNGQQQVYPQTYRQPQTTGSGTTATPNRSGRIYERRFYRQMDRTPRVHRAR